MATTYQDSTGKYFKSQADAAMSNTLLGTNPKNMGATPISTATLTQPIAPLKIAPTKIPTLATGLIEQAGATATAGLAAGEKEDAQMAELEKNSNARSSKLLSRISSQMAGREGQTSLTNDAYRSDLGLGISVDKTKQELNEINNQINAKTLAYRRRIETIQKNAEGKFGGAVEQDVRNVERQASSELADLSIIQMAKQNNFTGAKEIADRKVAAAMEQQNIDLENAKFFYQENKEQFSKQEDRQFQKLLGDRARAIEKESDDLKQVNDIGLQASENGADTATVQRILAAKTPSEAIAILGKFAQSPMLKFQLENARLQNMKLEKEISLLGEPTAAERKAQEAALKEAGASLPIMKDKILAVDLLKAAPGLNSRVGTGILTRTPQGFFGTVGKAATLGGLFTLPGDVIDKISGSGQDFAGGVHKLVGGLTLQSLIDAKARGATFGALSEGELAILANSASAINDWEIKKDGKGTGVWNIDQASFNRELDNIKALTQRAILLSEGTLISDDEDAVLDSVYSAQQLNGTPDSYYNN